MNLKVILLIFIFPFQIYSQEEIYLYPDKPSEFIFGEDSILVFIKKNFDICNHFNERRSATVQFVVEPNGCTSNLIFISIINDLFIFLNNKLIFGSKSQAKFYYTNFYLVIWWF